MADTTALAAASSGASLVPPSAVHPVAQPVAENAATAGEAAPALQKAAESATELGQFTWSGYLEAVGILFFMLALLWLLVWLVRRFGRFNFMPRPGALPRGSLVMEAQMPLGPRKGLMVVRFLNKRLLLGVTDQHITLLSEEKARHEPPAEFEKLMEEARSGPVPEAGPAGPAQI